MNHTDANITYVVPGVAAYSILARTLHAELGKVVPAPILLASGGVVGH